MPLGRPPRGAQSARSSWPNPSAELDFSCLKNAFSHRRGCLGQSAKELLAETNEKLPEHATLEETVARLLFHAAIDKGIADADEGRTISHAEARERLGL